MRGTGGVNGKRRVNKGKTKGRRGQGEAGEGGGLPSCLMAAKGGPKKSSLPGITLDRNFLWCSNLADKNFGKNNFYDLRFISFPSLITQSRRGGQQVSGLC